MDDDAIERAERVSAEIHRFARRATHDHAHSMGTAYRQAANMVRREFDLPEFDYYGKKTGDE